MTWNGEVAKPPPRRAHPSIKGLVHAASLDLHFVRMGIGGDITGSTRRIGDDIGRRDLASLKSRTRIPPPRHVLRRRSACRGRSSPLR